MLDFLSLVKPTLCWKNSFMIEEGFFILINSHENSTGDVKTGKDIGETNEFSSCSLRLNSKLVREDDSPESPGGSERADTSTQDDDAGYCYLYPDREEISSLCFCIKNFSLWENS